MDLFNLNNKVAIVTGGGSGIGQAVSNIFALQGAKVYVLELKEENAGETIKNIQKEDGKAEAVACDVSDQQQVKEAFENINQKEGKIDILVNNAGVSHIGNAETTTEEDLDRVYEVNVKGMYNCLHNAVIYMKKNNGGSIVNMASIASVVGIPDRFAYSMSKGAVYMMTMSVARDFINDNIRCNCISPARVHTPFVDNYLKQNYPGQEDEMFKKLSSTQPIGRMGKPEEIAYMALYLCSDEAGFVTGSNFGIDGGFTGMR